MEVNMIIFGWGHTTIKKHGTVTKEACPICGEKEGRQLCVVKTWFTLFFIPVIPYRTVHCILCPRCNNYKPISKDEFEEMKVLMSNGDSEAYKYVGKTPTQIAFLKQMEECKTNVSESEE